MPTITKEDAKMKQILIFVLIVLALISGCSDEPDGTPDNGTIQGKDGAPMVLIPAGEFQMGSNDGYSNEKPVHTVYLDAFYLDKYEVTNAQYKKFVQATGHSEPEGYGYGYVKGDYQDGFKPWQDKNFNGDNQPVGCVSWYNAKAYADWAGERLPTEAEWEKSARGGLDGYGLYDMAGNVWEWCADWCDGNYYANSLKSNPTGPSSGSNRVLRGGSVSYRDIGGPVYAFYDVGFRCVSGLR